MDLRNLFADLPADAGRETFETLLERPGVRLERIVSRGQATPPDEWSDQDADEWVALLAGAAALRFEGEAPRTLAPGDWVFIPAHRRHRVDWTAPDQPTVWLALHVT